MVAAWPIKSDTVVPEIKEISLESFCSVHQMRLKLFHSNALSCQISFALLLKKGNILIILYPAYPSIPIPADRWIIIQHENLV